MIRDRLQRRNVLFVATMMTLILVFIGAVPISDFLSSRFFLFSIYWAVCFILVTFILSLAIYDLGRVRNEVREEFRGTGDPQTSRAEPEVRSDESDQTSKRDL